MRRSYVSGWFATSTWTVPYRTAIASVIALTAAIRRASAAGSPNMRPGSGSRAVRTTAPESVSAATAVLAARLIAATSKRSRSVSLTPTMTEATRGRSTRAAGSWVSTTSAVRAPLTARLCSVSCSEDASCAAQPRQVPSGMGSPTPTVVESPSAANTIDMPSR